MIIDAHYHPYFIEEICQTESVAQIRRKELAYYKTPVVPLQHLRDRIKASGVDKCFLLPHDYVVQGGDKISIDEMKYLKSISDDLFFPFVSVDPKSETVVDQLIQAFSEYKLYGLVLNPAKQNFDPNDPSMSEIYDTCIEYNKPIIFHCGMSWEPDCLISNSHPMQFERVAYLYPKLRICLAHFGFPWVKETAVLMSKYRNIYSDTALLYFDSAAEFYHYVFNVQIPITWIDRSLRHQIMFGSNMPRWEQMRMLKALCNLELRSETLDFICCRNALEFLGLEECLWLN